ncbi:MAG TPA: tetratricopeptide repeat protein [Thermoanaerobaculia bacterium]|jgi:regulator of sirC expression with transglutaminase-like and TPR domain|nr:tetratricopeptide repeat protein [Thermoanaerobaculia bacterium]
MQREELFQRFQFLAATEEVDIFEGALLIAALIDPTEDLDAARAKAAELSQRVRDRLAWGEPAIDALRQVLFAEEAFQGDQETYDEPHNSSVASVIARRCGMPITLSIVTVEVGRRAGIRLNGVGLPGHFVVSGADLPEDTYLDPFDGGVLRDRDSVARRVSAVFGAPLALPDEIFAPDTERSVLARVLSNLRRSWERREKYADALETIRWAEVLDPEEITYQRERGLLLLKSGHSQEALVALEAYVAASSGEDADAVGKLIRVVKERGLTSGGAELVTLSSPQKRIFTLDEARLLLPKVKELTSDAVFKFARLAEAEEAEEERQGVVGEWAREILALGAEIKGLWLVDFDSGAGYYCWKYPETSLEYFHGYEEGFAGRLPLQ